MNYQDVKIDNQLIYYKETLEILPLMIRSNKVGLIIIGIHSKYLDTSLFSNKRRLLKFKSNKIK